MTSGPYMTDAMKNALLDKAQSMIRDSSDSGCVEGNGFWGVITTMGLHESVGSLSGQRFDAEITSFKGTTLASYIVRRSNVTSKDGRWNPLD